MTKKTIIINIYMNEQVNKHERVHKYITKPKTK